MLVHAAPTKASVEVATENGEVLARGEAGILTAWQHAPDRSWWRWSVEFSNHTDRPADWAPPGNGASR